MRGEPAAEREAHASAVQAESGNAAAHAGDDAHLFSGSGLADDGFGHVGFAHAPNAWLLAETARVT